MNKIINPWLLIPIVLVIVLGGWGASWFLIVTFGNDWPVRGQFGDMFGAVNALFSGLAFAGVIWAIWLQSRELALQRQELILQREELVATRHELTRSAGAQEEQVMAVKRQSETLRVTAELNTRTALMQVYAGGGGFGDTLPEKWQIQKEQLERILGELDPEYTP